MVITLWIRYTKGQKWHQPSILSLNIFVLFYFISFTKESKTYNVTKLKKGVGRDTATSEAVAMSRVGYIYLFQKGCFSDACFIDRGAS